MVVLGGMFVIVVCFFLLLLLLYLNKIIVLKQQRLISDSLLLSSCLHRLAVNVSIFIGRASMCPQIHLALVYTLEVSPQKFIFKS